MDLSWHACYFFLPLVSFSFLIIFDGEFKHVFSKGDFKHVSSEKQNVSIIFFFWNLFFIRRTPFFQTFLFLIAEFFFFNNVFESIFGSYFYNSLGMQSFDSHIFHWKTHQLYSCCVLTQHSMGYHNIRLLNMYSILSFFKHQTFELIYRIFNTNYELYSLYNIAYAMTFFKYTILLFENFIYTF